MSFTSVKLTVLSGVLKGTAYEFHEPAVFVVGRAEGCRPRLGEAMSYADVSRHHCLLIVNPPAVRILDLGSRNGTFVNGVKIGQLVALGPGDGKANVPPSSSRRLCDGDRIRLGRRTLLRVAVGAPERTEA